MAGNFPVRYSWAMRSEAEKARWAWLFAVALLLLFVGYSLWITVVFAPPRVTRYTCFLPSIEKKAVDSLFQPIALRALVCEKVQLPYVQGSRVPEAFFLVLAPLGDTPLVLGGSMDGQFAFSDAADLRLYVPREVYDRVAMGDTFRKVAQDFSYLLLSRAGDSLLSEPGFHYSCHCRQRNYSHDRKDGRLCCWGTP